MEVRARYQYTYFIYPYLIKENKYIKYLSRLINSKSFELKIFQRDKDYDVYKYFLPKIKDYMFKGFMYNKENIRALNEMNTNTKAAILAKEPCIIFESNIKNDIHGKTGEEEGIFFKIQNMQIVCFNTGICFLCIKTNVEDIEEFSNILNFNYKFKEISLENNKLSTFDHIRIQTNAFNNMKDFKQFIQYVTGIEYNNSKQDVDFYTYSYVCVNQDVWNRDVDFKGIQDIFEKYINILPQDNSVNYNNQDVKIISNLKYAKMGITKKGVALFCSSADINNYTKLPLEYETIYLYTYIFTLYKKIYLQKIGEKFKIYDFTNFTKKIWIHEITADIFGTNFYNSLKEVWNIDSLYLKTKNKYDVLYKEKNIEKDKKINKVIILLLISSLIFNILNFIVLLLK